MDEIYIKAKISDLLALIVYDTSLRRISSEGYIMLNTTDIEPIPGNTVEEKIKKINGTALTTAEAKVELSKKMWNE